MPSQPDGPVRGGIVLIFIMFGGPLGAATGVVFMLMHHMLQNGLEGIGGLLLFGFIPIMGGLAFGLPFAATAGLAYAWLSSKWQHPPCAILVGAGSVLVLLAPFTDDWSSVLAMMAMGAVAAFVCAGLVRWLGIDWKGAIARRADT
jgi:hypothetical protein